MKIFYSLIVATLVLFAGCSSEKSDWQKARNQNNIQAFEQFVKNHPQSVFKDSANYFIEKIAFDQAFADNTLKSYLELINKYPENRFLKKLSKAGDELIIDSLSEDYVKNTELVIKKSVDNKIRIKWIVPPHEKFNIGGMICEAGADGYSIEKEAPDSVYVEINAETITIEKDVRIYISKNIILHSGANDSKFKRLPDKKVSFLEGVIYEINLK